MFHETLREAIRARGLTLERVRHHLAERGCTVGLSTLSGWQHGHTRPASSQAVQALEDVLELPCGTLAALIPHGELDERTGTLGELLDSLPGSRERGMDILSHHDKVLVDASGHAYTTWSRIVVRARRDGLDRYYTRFFGDRGCDLDAVVVEPVDNCRLGRVRRHPSVPVMVTEILFGQSLAAGQTWVFERRISDGGGQPTLEYAYAVRQRVSQYVLQVRFDPAARPVECVSFAQPNLYEPVHRTARLALTPYHSVHLTAGNLVAGVLGIAWTWP